MLWRLLVNLLIKTRHYKFKQWIDLEDKKLKIIRVSDKNKNKFPDLIFEFLSDALPIPIMVWGRLPWGNVWGAFKSVSHALSFPHYLPLISLPFPKDKKQDSVPWDYPGRLWYFYAHTLAQSYGWTFEHIARMSVRDGMSAIQEILLDEQMNREFLWSMSEASVSYDVKTKTTKPNPLPRPYWMTQAKPSDPLPIPRIKIPKNLMPVGIVNYDALTDEYKPKEIDTP